VRIGASGCVWQLSVGLGCLAYCSCRIILMSDGPLFALHGGDISLVIEAVIGAVPRIVYLGERLSSDTNLQQVQTLTQVQSAMGGPDVARYPSLSCEAGLGLNLSPGLVVQRGGKDWGAVLRVAAKVGFSEHLTASDGSLKVICEDSYVQLRAAYNFHLSPSGVIRTNMQVTNLGRDPLTLDYAASAVLPVPENLTEMIRFSGRWAGEFQMHRHAIEGGYIAENRRGRTSHDRFPALVFAAPETREQSGPCLGLHLAWSGNSVVRVEAQNDGQALAQMGAGLFGEARILAQGETFETPDMLFAYSAAGLNGLSQAFHNFYHDDVRSDRAKGPRPIHCNTWEAMYFDQTPDKVLAMARAAADVGVERFVLDDGWFKGRRSDKAGLGDWSVDKGIYPDGLGPIIDEVKALGMDFGLWVEPEMVNADSDLYRAHPDWVLSAPHVDQVPFRNQMVLDLTRDDVSDYLFKCIDDLLTEYDIAYLKWDMNRDLNHAGGRDGRIVQHEQTLAVYALLARVRAAHPHVEIETCASGGGRADYGILAHTDRVWTSDSNDALDRQMIQRGASMFFPLSILGAHVGPATCHITGRKASMGLRAATAMYGAMGVEANLLEMDAGELATLKAGFDLFKAHRGLLHDGRFVRVDRPAHENVVGVVARDKGEALFSYVLMRSMPDRLPGRLRFVGLDTTRDYRVRCVWPHDVKTPYPHVLERGDLVRDGVVASGDALMKVGLQLPQVFPETALVFHFQATR
jgi:alpha-galactosidase